RGEIAARFEGIPAGGYAIIKVDDNFRQATAQDSVILDTISDRVTFPRGDASYKLEVTVINRGGKRVGTAAVSFNVANGKVDERSDSVRLVHWTPQDRLLTSVQRYRVFAESNASITGGAAAGGMGGGMAEGGRGGMAGGGMASGASGYLPAPLDFQVAALMRREVRDVGLLNGSANIKTLVQEGFERQREGSGAAGGAGGAAPTAAAAPAMAVAAKGPWTPDWNPSTETGKLFIKMIEQNGTEINATRKAPTIAIADLLPTFPDVAVRPGSTWETTMSFVGDLSTRTPVNVRSPITFTAYENVQTASGESRRCAKLESRFRLPDNLAKRIAANLANKVGAGGAAGGAAEGGVTGGRGGAMMGGEGGAAAATFTENDIQVARTEMARVLWFDVERRRILRSEDVIRSNFEIPTPPAAAGGAMDGGGMVGGRGMEGGMGGAPAAPAEPQRVAYDLRVTTWLDDRIPNPTGQYVPGGGPAHTRDSVTEPGLSRVLRPATPRR
ncbi:MAG TPA: hypothetical protein VF627_08015, partial [Abditibacterium sp.]